MISTSSLPIIRRSTDKAYINTDPLEPIFVLLQREMDYLQLIYRCPQRIRMPELHSHWRSNIFEWFYKIIDHFMLHRALVSVAMDYFDRYLLVHEQVSMVDDNLRITPSFANVTHDLKTYQLAAMTSLYLAMKLHAGNEEGSPTSPWIIKRKTFCLSGFAKLSRGNFTPQDILDMESDILKSLQWRMNPITPACFLDALMSLFPSTDEMIVMARDGNVLQVNDRYVKEANFSRYIFYELARYLFELAMCIPGITPYFQSANSVDSVNLFSSSAIAFASANLAMDMISVSAVSPNARETFYERCATLKTHPVYTDILCCHPYFSGSDDDFDLKDLIYENFNPEFVLGNIPGHFEKNPFILASNLNMFTSVFSKTDPQPESPTSPFEEATI